MMNRTLNAPRAARPLRLVALLLALATLATAAPAFAAEEEDLDDVPGEAVLKTRYEFVKFTVDGRSSWENHHYEDKFKTLIIRGLSRSDDHTIVLTPMDDKVEPYTLTLTAADFKRQRIRKKIDGRRQRVTVFRATRKIKFAKKRAEAAKDDAGKGDKGGKKGDKGGK